MKIVLTGATGFLGQHLYSALSFNNQVVAIVRDLDNKSFNDIILVGDIDNSEKWQDVDVVIHTATCYGRNGETREDIYNTNVTFSCAILNKAIEFGVKRFINIGTALLDEANYYAETKNTFGKIGLSQQSLLFLDLKCEHFYGINTPKSNFLRFVVDKCIRNERLDLTTGLQKRDFINVDDLTKIIVYLCDYPLLSNKTISVGTGVAPSIKEVVVYIKKLLNSDSQLNFGAIATDNNKVLDSIADICFLKEIGCLPSTTWQDGIKDWLIKEGYL